MKRILRGIAAIALVASLGAISASPASAHTEVCVGQASANSPPLFFTGTGPYVAGSVNFVLWYPVTGVCVPTWGNASLAGFLAGWCDQFNGTGHISGHQVDFTSAGTLMVLFSRVFPPSVGAVVGIAHVVPDVTTVPPQSCLTGATRLLVTGAFIMI